MDQQPPDTASHEQHSGPTPPLDPRQGGKRYDVFISHAGPQKLNFAGWLQQRIEAAGFSAFLDETNLHYGEESGAVMEAVVRSSQVQFMTCHMLPQLPPCWSLGSLHGRYWQIASWNTARFGSTCRHKM